MHDCPVLNDTWRNCLAIRTYDMYSYFENERCLCKLSCYFIIKINHKYFRNDNIYKGNTNVNNLVYITIKIYQNMCIKQKSFLKVPKSFTREYKCQGLKDYKILQNFNLLKFILRNI